jgi:hypothetical protein
MQYFNLAVFEPEENDPEWVVLYHCCYGNGDICTSSESYWVVPGTLEW